MTPTRRHILAVAGSGLFAGCIGPFSQSPEEEIAEYIDPSENATYRLAREYLDDALDSYEDGIWNGAEHSAGRAKANYQDLLNEAEEEFEGADGRRRELYDLFANHIGYAEMAADELQTAAQQMMDGQEGRAEMSYEHALDNLEEAQDYGEELRIQLNR